MKLEQHLQLQQQQKQKQTQKLVMTQQLQQSIQILQSNLDELTSLIETKALENPLIELKITEFNDRSFTNFSYSPEEEQNYLEQIPEQHASLFKYLIDQIHLNYRDTYLRSLMLFLVEYIDLNGYLTISLEEAIEKTESSSIQMLDALTLIQQLDPPGVGARSLQECLMLQVERDDKAPELAYIILEENFMMLVQRKWQEIAKKFAISLVEVQNIFDYIQTLTPYPGSIFEANTGLYIRPDLTVSINNRKITIQSNQNRTFQLNFQQAYFKRMEETNDEEVKRYLKEKKAEFDWLKKSIEQRGNTILRIGQFIVEKQAEFFLLSDHPLQPLALKDAAIALSLHESTISRAVNEKYLETIFGIFELRSFFSSNITYATYTGECISTRQIKEKLHSLIEQEDKTRPLSDQKIVLQLKNEGIEISRRTVTKYREALGISASSKRKRYN